MMRRTHTLLLGAAVGVPALGAVSFATTSGHTTAHGRDVAAVSRAATGPGAGGEARGTITRATVLARARWWLNKTNIPYSQRTCYTTAGKRASCRPGTF